MKFSFSLIKQNKRFLLLLLAGALGAWNIFLLMVDVEAFTANFGVHNAYIILFFVALTSGASFFTVASLYATLIAYVHGGLSPIALGVIAGLGVSVGDFVFYAIGRTVGSLAGIKKYRIYRRIFTWLERLPKKVAYIFVFLFASFSPFPSDIIMLSLGVLRYNYKPLIPIIVFGNIIFLNLVAHGIMSVL